MREEIEKLEIKIGSFKNWLSEARKEKKIKKQASDKAKVAAYDKRSREEAKNIRSMLHKEISSNWSCPYCNINKNKNQIHADHIHPISKGGMSVLENMVLICSECNQKKSDLPFVTFLFYLVLHF